MERTSERLAAGQASRQAPVPIDARPSHQSLASAMATTTSKAPAAAASVAASLASSARAQDRVAAADEELPTPQRGDHDAPAPRGDRVITNPFATPASASGNGRSWIRWQTILLAVLLLVVGAVVVLHYLHLIDLPSLPF